MRRLLLPPPGMWPCDRPILHVLNGDYPAAELRRMSVPGLERLVSKLVQCTSSAASKPKWWPASLSFTHPLDLGLSNEHEIKLAFHQLIVSCCQFFENRRRRRPRPHSPQENKKPKPPNPTKHQFLHYFRLNSKRAKVSESGPPPAAAAAAATAKLATCIHIPFSSDVGRIMAARENHAMNEDLKMRRLERSEWYINKAVSKVGDVEYEIAAPREPSHSHVYKIPRRQQHHKRRSLHDVNFLARFCTPVSVVVTRLDLEKLRSDKKKQLVVLIKDTEKMCCDLKHDVKNIRSSPRLRNV